MGLFLEPDAFLGSWRLTKTIDDRRAGQVGEFRGLAVLRPGKGGDLVYAETGKVRMGQGPVLSATRRYLWRRGQAGFEVFFEDGRPFHGINLVAATCEARHWCDPDTYDVRYDFSDFPRWSAVWRVLGPKKDYSMRCCYVPQSQPLAGGEPGKVKGIKQFGPIGESDGHSDDA